MSEKCEMIAYAIAAGIGHYRPEPERLAEFRRDLEARGFGDQWVHGQRMADDSARYLDFTNMTGSLTEPEQPDVEHDAARARANTKETDG